MNHLLDQDGILHCLTPGCNSISFYFKLVSPNSQYFNRICTLCKEIQNEVFQDELL